MGRYPIASRLTRKLNSMTDDLVARLRYEQELCAVMGDTKAGTLVGEAAGRAALEGSEK